MYHSTVGNDGTWTTRAVRKGDEERKTHRARVCSACVYTTDHVLGFVHSELACDRCGATPCSGAMVETKDQDETRSKS